MSFISKIKVLLKNKKVLVALGVIAVLLVGYFFIFAGNGESELVAADMGKVAETVSVSGKTKAVSAVDLGFEGSGRIARIGARAGERVAAGTVIVALESGELRATLAGEEAKLAELMRGTRPAELAITQASLDKARREAYVAGDNAVHNSADTFFGGSRPNWRSSLLTFIKTDTKLVDDLVAERKEVEDILDNWERQVEVGTTVSPSSIVNYLTKINQFLAHLAVGINDIEPDNNNDFTQSEVDSYKSTLASARDSVADALANLTTADKELILDEQGSAPEVIAAQQARVDQYRAQLNKNYLVAPIGGLVTLQEGEVGEIVPAGDTIVSIISEGNLEIESFVPEVHIGRLMIGNKAQITLDALPGETFMGVITYIDPAETEISSVPNYKIKVSLETKDERLKSGLTANLKIETASKDNVIRLPRFALTEKEGLYFVTKVSGDKEVLSPVTIGLMGTDGMVEITSGLAPSQEVFIPEGATTPAE
ncbi:MAG: efflux RND transporter periplasmic adaptor subunit [Candidatus Pacebacteria bacterium]|nr:efflux RND transporter periplasmic adaptor subunit [Candidatus Paceibacterota bacterium]